MKSKLRLVIFSTVIFSSNLTSVSASNYWETYEQNVRTDQPKSDDFQEIPDDVKQSISTSNAGNTYFAPN